ELIEPGAPPQIILCHGLPPGDRRLAEARALIEGAFAIEPADRSPGVMDPTASRILEVLR
ncbi:MAG TPA: hypothetical protein VGD80_30630, partial [Kofleriaceae bacterium]